MHSLYATDSTVTETHFDASRVISRCQHVLDDALDLSAGGLICFEDDGDCCARYYLADIWDRHVGLIEDFLSTSFFKLVCSCCEETQNAQISLILPLDDRRKD